MASALVPAGRVGRRDKVRDTPPRSESSSESPPEPADGAGRAGAGRAGAPAWRGLFEGRMSSECCALDTEARVDDEAEPALARKPLD